MIEKIHNNIQPELIKKYNQELVDMKPQDMLTLKSLIINLLLQQVLVYSHLSF